MVQLDDMTCFFYCCQMNHPLLLFAYQWMLIFPLFFPITFSQGCEEEEAEAFDVSLTKNTQGLGITIAGYVGDKNSGEKWQITCHIDVSLNIHSS